MNNLNTLFLKKKLISIFLNISLVLIFSILLSLDNTSINRITKTEVSGFYYKHIPYELKFSSNAKIDFDSSLFYIGRRSDSTFSFGLRGYRFENRVLRITDKNNEVLLKMIVKDPPVSLSFLGRKSGEFINKDAFLNNKASFTAKVINFNIDLTCEVEKFDILYFDGNNLCTLSSNSSKISEEQKQALNKLNKNTIVLFKNITVRFPDNSIVEIEPFSLCVEVN